METNYAGENYLLVQGNIEHATNADKIFEMRRIKKTLRRPDQAYHKVKVCIVLRKLLARQESP
jgi:hypothetical protein